MFYRHFMCISIYVKLYCVILSGTSLFLSILTHRLTHQQRKSAGIQIRCIEFHGSTETETGTGVCRGAIHNVGYESPGNPGSLTAAFGLIESSIHTVSLKMPTAMPAMLCL